MVEILGVPNTLLPFRFWFWGCPIAFCINKSPIFEGARAPPDPPITTSLHLGLRPFECDVCDKTYPYQTGLIVHKRKEHLKLETDKCDICSKEFKTREGLKRHELTAHVDPEGQQKNIHCEMCDYKTYWKEKLNQHIKRVHSDC